MVKNISKMNDHKYWVIEDGQKKYCSYATEAFVDWLNQFITKDEGTTIVAISSRRIDDTLPIIFFSSLKSEIYNWNHV